MNIKKGVGYSALALVGLATVGGTVLAVEPSLAQQAAERVGITSASFGQGHGWHGGHHRGGRSFMRICGAAKGERLDSMIGFVENIMEFNEQQQAAWNELATALRDSRGVVIKTCDGLREAGRPDSAPEKLAMVETALQTGLTTVQQVRPAFEKFYGTLSEKQRQALDDLASRHHRRSH